MSSKSGPIPVLLLGWLIPGGGHFLLGRRTQAGVFFVTVTATFLAGMALSDFGNVSLERHTYYFLAHIFNGAETLLAWFLTKGLLEDHVPTHFGMHTGEVGVLYTAVACLLNVIVVMDAYALVLGLKGAKETPEPAVEPAP
jgi:Family of unknown function (DUF6677)